MVGILLAGVVVFTLPSYMKTEAEKYKTDAQVMMKMKVKELEVLQEKNKSDSQVKMKALEVQQEKNQPVSRGVTSEVEKARLLDKYLWMEALGHNSDAELEDKTRK